MSVVKLSVADLGGRWGRSPPLREKFFDFSQQNRTKNELILPRMDPKNYFLLTTAPPFEKKCPPPSKILDPPLQSFLFPYFDLIEND